MLAASFANPTEIAGQLPDLVLRDVSVRRGTELVVMGVDLRAPSGAVTALVGPNGAGKTTLLSAIAGLVPAHGQIDFDGRPLRALGAAARARAVAFVPQRSDLSARMAVWDVVSCARFSHGARFGALRASDRLIVDGALEAMDVARLADRPFTELSAGEQRRVLIARALATEAPVLLLDEPTASLDLFHSLTLGAHLRSLSTAGRCVVAVLHDLGEVRRLADHVVLLQDGRVVASGHPRSVVAPTPVASVYGVELCEHGGLGYRLSRPLAPPSEGSEK